MRFFSDKSRNVKQSASGSKRQNFGKSPTVRIAFTKWHVGASDDFVIMIIIARLFLLFEPRIFSPHSCDQLFDKWNDVTDPDTFPLECPS